MNIKDLCMYLPLSRMNPLVKDHMLKKDFWNQLELWATLVTKWQEIMLVYCCFPTSPLARFICKPDPSDNLACSGIFWRYPRDITEIWPCTGYLSDIFFVFGVSLRYLKQETSEMGYPKSMKDLPNQRNTTFMRVVLLWFGIMISWVNLGSWYLIQV